MGELLEVDFETMRPMQLYRASDALMAHREAIERHLFDRAMGLFDLHPTVTLYDLTNTFFEGEAPRQPKAKRGHSKDKRSDCPLLTLALVLDASGFVRRSDVFAGNVREHDETASWDTVRRILEAQQRITATFRRADGRTLHVRKATCAGPPQQAIYDALGVDPEPGGIRKTADQGRRDTSHDRQMAERRGAGGGRSAPV